MNSLPQFRSLAVRAFTGLVLVGVTSVAPATAQNLILSDGGIHEINGLTIPGRLIIFNNTTVNFRSGSIGSQGLDSVSVFGGTFNMFGGSTTGGRIAALGNSVVNLYGGTLGSDSAVSDSLVTFNNATANVLNITASGRAASVGGVIRIYGGSFSGGTGSPYAAAVFSTGRLEIFGGSFGGGLVGVSSGVIEVRGGLFTSPAPHFMDTLNSATITFFGSLTLVGSRVTKNQVGGHVSGTLENGDALNAPTYGTFGSISVAPGG